MLGLAAVRQSRYEDAVKYFREAIQLDPQEATLHFQLALALAALGKTDEARPELEKTAKLDPLHGGAQYQLATYARKAGDQEAFRRYMRNYERIRKIKGAADADALEECRYTKPEAVVDQSAAHPQPGASPAESVAPVWKSETLTGAPPFIAAAVLSMDESGRYQLFGITSEGSCIIFEFDAAGHYREVSRNDKPLDGVGARAVVAVGNALVDSRLQRDQQQQSGDFPEIAVVTPERSWFLHYTPGKGFDDLTESSKLAGAGRRRPLGRPRS